MSDIYVSTEPPSLEAPSAKILIVDDDADMLRLLKIVVEEEGAEVVTGQDGQMAVALALKHKPHLILMDVNMPMTHGLKALDYIRQQPGLKTVPVVLMTGENIARVEPSINKHTHVGYLPKPVDLNVLRSLVRLVLRLPAAR